MINEKTVKYLASTTDVSEEAVKTLWAEFEARHNNQNFSSRFAELAKLNSELKNRIAYREEVISNTLRKFPAYSGLEITRLSVNTQLLSITRGDNTYQLDSLPDGFKLERSDLLHFTVPEQANGRYYRVVKVPASQLWNDPIAVSVYTRTAVRKAQKAWAEDRKKTAATKTQSLKNDLAKLEKELADAQKQEADLIAQTSEPWEKRLKTLNAEEKIGEANVNKLHSILRASREMKWGRPGIFAGEEENSIRLEWHRKNSSTTFEINKAGEMFLYYGDDVDTSVSIEPTSINKVLVFLETHLKNIEQS